MEHHPDRVIGEGNEHIVEHSSDRLTVLKHTKPPGFGFVLQPHIAPFGSFATVRTAAPHEYLERLDHFNAAFGDATRLQGVSKIGDHVRLAVSQRSIKGAVPKEAKIHAVMRAGGYRRVKSSAIENAHFKDKVWFHPETGYVVSDVKPDNFKQDAKGRVVPIDLIVQHAPPGSDLRRMMEQRKDEG